MEKMKIEKKDKLELVAFHLGSFFVPVFVTLGFFLVEDEGFVKQSAKNTLNFQLSIVIYLLISLLLTLVVVGIIGLLVFPIVFYFFTVVSLINTCNGHNYEYPITIKFIK